MLFIAFGGPLIVKDASMLYLQLLWEGLNSGSTGTKQRLRVHVQIHGPHSVPWSVVDCGVELPAILLPTRTNSKVPSKNPSQAPCPYPVLPCFVGDCSGV